MDKRVLAKEGRQITLSVLIPAYNPGKWLRGIMDKLSEQIPRHPDTEVVVVDDGSTEVLLWVCDYPKTRYIRKVNGGEPTARNECLRAARGSYIQWIDADDEIYDNFLDVVYDNISQGYDFVSYEFDTDHDVKRSYHNYGQLMVNCPVWAYTFKRSFVGDAMFVESMKTGCDVEYLQRVLREDAKHKHDERVIYNYRWDGNENSLCHQYLRGEI